MKNAEGLYREVYLALEHFKWDEAKAREYLKEEFSDCTEEEIEEMIEKAKAS